MKKKLILLALFILLPFNLFMKYGTTPEVLRIYEFLAFIVFPVVALIGYSIALYLEGKQK